MTVTSDPIPVPAPPEGLANWTLNDLAPSVLFELSIVIVTDAKRWPSANVSWPAPLWKLEKISKLPARYAWKKVTQMNKEQECWSMINLKPMLRTKHIFAKLTALRLTSHQLETKSFVISHTVEWGTHIKYESNVINLTASWFIKQKTPFTGDFGGNRWKKSIGCAFAAVIHKAMQKPVFQIMQKDLSTSWANKRIKVIIKYP